MILARVLHLAVWRAAHPPATPRPQPPTPPLGAIRTALARAERLAPRPVEVSNVVVLHARRQRPPPATSAWDPEPATTPATPAAYGRRDEELILQEINGCKTLLLEIIRRAAYDYVLYRNSRRMVQKVLAEQAYRWLFTEVPASPEWQERQREGKHITSFVSICESLDLDPDAVRVHIKRLTPRNVMSVGRPAEYRRRDVFSTSGGDNDAYSTPGVLVEYADDPSDDGDPSY